jgi:hypothetical protein
MPLTQAKTGIDPIDRLLAWTHHRWEWMRRLIIGTLHFLFLSHRKLHIQEDNQQDICSVREYFKKNGYKLFNPSYLPYQIDEARQTGKGPFVGGELFWSHTDEKKFQVKAMNGNSNAFSPGSSQK